MIPVSSPFNQWSHADDDRRDGFSVVAFATHQARHRHPPPALVQDILEGDAISSVQITFHEDKPPEQHAMPPGGFRVAIVNAWDLEAGIEARARLAEMR